MHDSAPAREDLAAELRSKIERGEATIGVIGLGYVGLPLAIAFACRGYRVVGFDTDSRKIEQLGRGAAAVDPATSLEWDLEGVWRRFTATADLGRLGECDVVVICVPTPLTRQREPDMGHVNTAVRSVRDTLRLGQLVILESTTYPGTTDELVRSTLEESGLSAEREFFLAFSPEREDPGNAKHSLTKVPKVVGGLGQEAGDLATQLYSRVVCATVGVSNPRTAEAVKLTENIFRAVNIALVNELKMVFEPMGIDVWEVLDAAATKPFGFMRFDPGPGLGGHCIPLDPFYLTWKAREYGISTRFIELAGEINAGMPKYVLERTQSALNQRGLALSTSRILVLGVAYKRDISDCRESPALELIRLLWARGARVSYHDPRVASIEGVEPQREIRLASVELTDDVLGAQDAVLVVTDHSGVDYDHIFRTARLIVDARGVYRGSFQHVVKA